MFKYIFGILYIKYMLAMYFMKHFKYFLCLSNIHFEYLINILFNVEISFVFRLLDTKLMASTQPFKV